MRNICLSAGITCFLLLASASLCFSAEPAGYAFVSGHVRDNVSGQPLSGVKIRLQCGFTQQDTTTNTSGHYEFPGVPIYKQNNLYLNKTLIFALAEKYKTEMEKTELLPGQRYAFDFFLDTRFKYPILKGRVIDNAASSGIAGAVITASGEAGETYTAISDVNGYYKLRIENKGVGRYSVMAAAAGYRDSETQSIKTFPTQTYTLNFSLERVMLGVHVAPDTWQIGKLAAQAIAVMSPGEEIMVTNTGNANQTYSLMLVNPPGWTASGAAVGIEQYVLNAAFATGLSKINWDEVNCAVLTQARLASESRFAADQNGVNVPPGEQRILYLQFKAPLKTAVPGEQNIELIINAETP